MIHDFPKLYYGTVKNSKMQKIEEQETNYISARKKYIKNSTDLNWGSLKRFNWWTSHENQTKTIVSALGGVTLPTLYSALGGVKYMNCLWEDQHYVPCIWTVQFCPWSNHISNYTVRVIV